MIPCCKHWANIVMQKIVYRETSSSKKSRPALTSLWFSSETDSLALTQRVVADLRMASTVNKIIVTFVSDTNRSA